MTTPSQFTPTQPQQQLARRPPLRRKRKISNLRAAAAASSNLLFQVCCFKRPEQEPLQISAPIPINIPSHVINHQFAIPDEFENQDRILSGISLREILNTSEHLQETPLLILIRSIYGNQGSIRDIYKKAIGFKDFTDHCRLPSTDAFDIINGLNSIVSKSFNDFITTYLLFLCQNGESIDTLVWIINQEFQSTISTSSEKDKITAPEILFTIIAEIPFIFDDWVDIWRGLIFGDWGVIWRFVEFIRSLEGRDGGWRNGCESWMNLALRAKAAGQFGLESKKRFRESYYLPKVVRYDGDDCSLISRRISGRKSTGTRTGSLVRNEQKVLPPFPIEPITSKKRKRNTIIIQNHPPSPSPLPKRIRPISAHLLSSNNSPPPPRRNLQPRGPRPKPIYFKSSKPSKPQLPQKQQSLIDHIVEKYAQLPRIKNRSSQILRESLLRSKRSEEDFKQKMREKAEEELLKGKLIELAESGLLGENAKRNGIKELFGDTEEVASTSNRFSKRFSKRKEEIDDLVKIHEKIVEQVNSIDDDGFERWARALLEEDEDFEEEEEIDLYSL